MAGTQHGWSGMIPPRNVRPVEIDNQARAVTCAACAHYFRFVGRWDTFTSVRKRAKGYVR